MLKVDNVAAFGRPVVPEVNWMLAGEWTSIVDGNRDSFLLPKRSLKFNRPSTLY